MTDIIKYKGRKYPRFQAEGFSSQFAIPYAKHVCKGIGYDIGCLKREWAFPGSIPIDKSFDDKYDAFNLPQCNVDYIFSSHCLEHIERWVDAIDYWGSVLKAGGVLFLYLPHFNQEYWRPWNNRKHIHSFTPEIIKSYYVNNGYTNIFCSDRDLNDSFMIFGEKKKLSTVNYFDFGLCYGRELNWVVDSIFPDLGIDDYHAYGFEPCESCFVDLDKKYTGNSNITIVNSAISDSCEPKKLYHSYKRKKYTPIGNSIFKTKYNVHEDDYEEVGCVVFSNWVKDNVPNFKESFNIIRMNMEGGEWHLFNDLKNNNMLVDIDIFCGTDVVGEMQKIEELKQYIPDLTSLLSENNIKVHHFIDETDIETMINLLKEKQVYSRKNICKNVIYTVIIGDYDRLHDPLFITPGWDYVCFTDNKDMKSDVWKIKHIETDPELSDRKNARKVKLLYHEYVGEYENTIYVPGYNLIKVNLDDVMASLKPGCDMVLLKHPRRKCVYDEAKHIIELSKDPTGSVQKQVDCYKKDGMPIRQGLSAGGLIIRRGNQSNVIKHCELWWEEIKKHSPRDQISFMYILWKYELIKTRRLKFGFFNTHFAGTDHHIGTTKEIQENSTL